MAVTFCLSAQGTLYVWTGAHFEQGGTDKKGLPLFNGAPIKTRDIHDNECCIPEDAERWRKVNDDFRNECKMMLKVYRTAQPNMNLNVIDEKHCWQHACRKHLPGIKTFPSRGLKADRPRHKVA